ncbi:peptidase [Actinorhabdospora filicis]|uniref:Peptidase n=1 Tax=Actinorhabdospora filicis TaxID=1785913 RepID=A0A9W6WAK7_9ACTN|nr:prolyl oligopeptidase family serine peptidase [Actinorhabdospora filicis]GLZ79759.1 peptidase [Actinorhabdospora filicis]
MSDTLPRQLARTHSFTLGAPGDCSVTADGTVLFLRSRAGDDPALFLWAYDPATGEERVVAGPGDEPEDLPEAEKVRRERERVHAAGITRYVTDGEGTVAVYGLGGKVWIADVATGESRELPVAAGAVDPRPDATGAHVAYVAEGALRVIGADGSNDRVLASSEDEAVYWGLPEHVAGESMHRYKGYWWSPDGAFILAAEVDESPIATWWISDPSEPAAAPRSFRYPAAGTDNAIVKLWILGLDGSRVPVQWDREGFEYVATGGWDAHGPIISVQSRDQQTVRILAIDPATGATSPLRELQDDKWVELFPGVPARLASGKLLTIEDSDDTWYLCVDGAPVTPPATQVRGVLGVDGESVQFTASTNGLTVHLWTWDAEEGPRRRSVEPGVHRGVRRGEVSVHVSYTPERVGPRVRVTAFGRTGEITSHVEQPVLTAVPEYKVIGERKIQAAIYRPTGYDGERLPVLLDPYAGPGGQKVTATLGGGALASQWWADQGFIVIVADGTGTPGRGPASDKLIHQEKLAYALEDQITALQAVAAEYPGQVDTERVAMRGWSYGGYLAAAAVLRRPDVFHAGVAGAPVTDVTLYDTHWQERYLGHPAQFPDVYRRNSLLDDAPNLRRPLLLVHGFADDNVVMAHSLRLSAALLAAGKHHEVLPLLRTTHMPTDEESRIGLLLHELAFLKRALAEPEK